MPTLIPSFYPAFRCDPSRCQHSCCVDWEIGIDDESLRCYRTRTDALGQEIMSRIDSDPYPHFTLSEGDRCPFLRSDGLCTLILREGETVLPEICREHPRFRNFYGEDFVELSLGLSCEIAAELLLREENLHFLISPMEVDSLTQEYATVRFSDLTALPKEDEAFLQAKYRILFSLLENGTLPSIPDTQGYEENARLALRTLPKLEALNVDFATLFDAREVESFLFDAESPSRFSENEKKNLLAMTFFRHASAESFYTIPTALAFSKFFVSLVDYLATIKHYDKVEAVRLLSSEIEYSEENTELLLDTFESV